MDGGGKIFRQLASGAPVGNAHRLIPAGAAEPVKGDRGIGLPAPVGVDRNLGKPVGVAHFADGNLVGVAVGQAVGGRSGDGGFGIRGRVTTTTSAVGPGRGFAAGARQQPGPDSRVCDDPLEHASMLVIEAGKGN